MEEILDEVNYSKKIIKNNFNNPLKVTKDDENDFNTTD